MAVKSSPGLRGRDGRVVASDPNPPDLSRGERAGLVVREAQGV